MSNPQWYYEVFEYYKFLSIMNFTQAQEVPILSIKSLSKSFGLQTVLSNVSLDIHRGQTTAIVGPSGAGKSVLIKLIMGILAPDSGQVFIRGIDMAAKSSEYEKNKLRQGLSMLFQSAALFDSLTVYENIGFPLSTRLDIKSSEVHDRVMTLATSLSLNQVLSLYPQQISMGTRKRVGMARALVTEPEIILFDEPNTGLDPVNGQEVYDLINECRVKWGFTGLVISHELPEVFQVVDRVAMLLQGIIIKDCTPTEFAASTIPAVQQFLHGKIDGPINIQ